MVEQSFETLLKSSAPVSALVSDRVFGLVLLEKSVLPAIDYKVVGATSSPTFTTMGSQRYRVEVNCWGSNYASAVTLRAAVIAALNGYSDSRLQIQFLMSQDLFDYQLRQYRAVAEFYVFANL